MRKTKGGKNKKKKKKSAWESRLQERAQPPKQITGGGNSSWRPLPKRNEGRKQRETGGQGRLEFDGDFPVPDKKIEVRRRARTRKKNGKSIGDGVKVRCREYAELPRVTREKKRIKERRNQWKLLEKGG